MPPPLFILSEPNVLVKMWEVGLRAWLSVTAFLASTVTQAILATSQATSPYLLGVGEIFRRFPRKDP